MSIEKSSQVFILILLIFEVYSSVIPIKRRVVTDAIDLRGFCLSNQPPRIQGRNHFSKGFVNPKACSQIIHCKWNWPLHPKSSKETDHNTDSHALSEQYNGSNLIKRISTNGHHEQPSLEIRENTCPPCSNLDLNECPSGYLNWDEETQKCRHPLTSSLSSSSCIQEASFSHPSSLPSSLQFKFNFHRDREHDNLPNDGGDSENYDEMFLPDDSSECSPNYLYRRYLEKDKPETVEVIELSCPNNLLWNNRVNSCSKCDDVKRKDESLCCEKEKHIDHFDTYYL